MVLFAIRWPLAAFFLLQLRASGRAGRAARSRVAGSLVLRSGATWIAGGTRGAIRVDRPITQEAIAGEHLGGEFEHGLVAFEAGHGSGFSTIR